MFEEEETGKPKSFTKTIIIIFLVMVFNLLIIVVCRVLLDSENEINEPLVAGATRDDLITLLGIFSTTFCFGCWCCFCCGGNLCLWILALPKAVYHGLGYVADKLVPGRVYEDNTSTYSRDEDGESLDNFHNHLVAMSAMPFPPLHTQPSDNHPFERPVTYDNFINVGDEANSHAPKPTFPPWGRARAHSIDVSYA